jgi:hypothetical protein
MALRARTVLADCQSAYVLLQEHSGKDDWRAHWVNCLSLLRAVGHVLRKEAENDATLGPIQSKWWEALKANKSNAPLFWEFIEKERNQILKEYKFGVEPKPSRPIDTVGGRMIVTAKGIPIVTSKRFDLVTPVLSISDGREAIARSIAWWNEQLSSIEARLAE